MSLQVWLPLNGNTINQGVSGFQPATANIVYVDSGKISAKSYSNGTITMSAEQTASIFNNNSLTIAFWIKPTDTTTAHIIFGNDTNRQFSLFQYSGNTASYPHGLALHWDWRWEWESGINYNINGTTSSTTATWLGNVFSENEWSHVCVTYQRPVMKIYINGLLKATRTRKSSADDFSSFSYTTNLITTQSLSSRNLNDLRIYDHALSALEVKELSKGLVIHYTFDDELLTSHPTLLQNEAGLVQPSGVNNISLSTNSRIGKYSGQFNGSTSYIDTPMVKPDMFADDYTLNFWVYHNEADQRAVYFGDYNLNGMNFNIERHYQSNCINKLRYYHAANPDYCFDLTIDNKKWTMVTLKYVKAEKKLYAYVNGNVNNKKYIVHEATLTKNSGVMRIGRDGRSDSTALDGYMDDFRLYASALSDNDIQDLYNCGASLSDLGDAHANNFIENATYHGVDEKHNIQTNEIYENILGKDYQQLEYLEATGTQYIDTNYLPGSNTHIQITYRNNSDQLLSLFGARAATANDVFGSWIQGNSIYTHYGNRSYSAISPITGDTTKKFIYNQNKHIGTVLFDNGIESSAISAENLFTAPYTLTLLTMHDNEGIDNRKGKGYLYSCQIYDNGTLIRDYYPARRMSDKVLGLYDVVNNEFYINAGEGSFKAGPTVTVNETSAFTENKNFTSRQIIEI